MRTNEKKRCKNERSVVYTPCLLRDAADIALSIQLTSRQRAASAQCVEAAQTPYALPSAGQRVDR
jgi:hypothetical protein